jgi:hypothetical protein
MTDIAAEAEDVSGARRAVSGPAKGAEALAGTLPRRDLIILPLLSLATLLVLMVFSEIGARLYFAEAIDDACRIHGAAPGETRNRPDCHDELKLPEGRMAAYSYNECGYRTDAPCGPRAAGVKRIALIGSSMAQGYGVSYGEAFATRAGRALEKACGPPVQIENLGAVGNSILGMHDQIGEALGLHPDAVLMMVDPFDVWSLSDYPETTPSPPVRQADPAPEAAPPNLVHRVEMQLKSSRAMFLMQHFLFQDRALYIKAYLLYGDKADFLRAPFTQPWEQRFSEFERLAADMANQAHKAGVPFGLLLGPQQAQAILMSTKHLPDGVDPRAFGRRMAQIAQRHGIILIDSADAFTHVARPERDFFPVDGHPNEEGNAVIADSMVRGLMQSAPFAACARSAEN